MKRIESRLPRVPLRTVALLALVFVIPTITTIASSYLPEESSAVSKPLEIEDDGHALLISEDETEPLQPSADAEDILSVISQEEASHHEPEPEKEEASLSNKEADIREILTEAPEQPVNGRIIGSIGVPAVGLSDKLAIGTSINGAQEALEASSVIMCYEYMGLPEKAPVSVVGGHNYMEFNKLKNAKVGDDAILMLDWGVYEYVIYDIRIQTALSSAPRGHLVLYTCHPFDEKDNTTENAYFLCEPKPLQEQKPEVESTHTEDE